MKFHPFRGMRECRFLRVGSDWNNAAGNAGAFALNLNNSLGNSNVNYGAAPTYSVRHGGSGSPCFGQLFFIARILLSSLDGLSKLLAKDGFSSLRHVFQLPRMGLIG